MIKIKNLHKNYGSFDLKIADLTIGTNKITGVVGDNGAGKTTLFSACLDLISVNAGEISISDFPVARTDNWKKLTGAYLDQNFLIAHLTVEEFLYFTAEVYGLDKSEIKDILENFASFFDFDKYFQKKIRDLSLGNKQKVGLMSAFVHKAKLVLLDEPFSHLDPSSRNILKDLIFEYREKYQAAILISSHDLFLIKSLCDEVVLLENGKIIKKFEDFKENPEELESYFGGSK